jgi:hypothetical protein
MYPDIDLMRQILRAIEAAPKQTLDAPPAIAGFDDTAVVAHVKILGEAGLIETTPFIGRPLGEIKLTEAGRAALQTERDGVGDLSEFL